MVNRFGRAAILALGLAVSVPAWAAESSDTTQKILDILRDKKEITEEQYQDLKKGSDSEFRVFWDKGPTFATNDGNYVIKFGSRLQNDWAVLVPNSSLNRQFTNIDGTETGTEFRRARIQLEGTFYKRLDFKMEYDFAGGDVAFKDVYLGAHDVPIVGRFRLGYFKEPFSLEQLTSDSHTTFMERALPSAPAFAPDRNTGLAFYHNFVDNRVLLASGVFREAGDSANTFGGNDEYNLTTRISGLPWYEDAGRKLVHLGFSHSHKFRHNYDFDFNQRPEAHLVPTLIDTNDFEVDGVDLIDPEFALVVGPFSLQSEYMAAFASTPGKNVSFTGYYVYVSYFLTGESRPYSMSSGAFDRPIPKANAFDGHGGIGAWEVGARYSSLDLTDEAIKGGELHDVTLGANWYLNPYFKVMLNYVYANRSAEGEANIVEARFQLDF